MSLRPDGSYRCDRCGGSAGNGGVLDAATLVDIQFLDDGNAVPRNLHLCRANDCAAAVVAKANFPDYFTS